MVNCPSCTTPLEQNARFCGVCGYRLQENQNASGPVPQAPKVAPVVAKPNPVAQSGGMQKPPNTGARPKPRLSKGDDQYLGTTLNNRFKVESKIGEGGFGAVFRGVQLATGRKVALKLLHPEMTKDENLVARFRREGMVLCNLRDAHTITTYDFDQTPDGTLYIAMELLEGKSLHEIFHEQAPLEWKRTFKILTEMCSSLAEAHAQGIVHRDLKPENIYLETRPGNPEFVKILDFGIAKVMRGDAIDPASPQLTATGQTLGTLEYMSPEQLMGKPLDGRSDVYALGVVAYEMITGRLPFPDAKGPAGLITAQLKQTPQPPSTANPKANLPAAADRVILKCLEKDKANRHADVTALALALDEVIHSAHLPQQAQPQPQMPQAPVIGTPAPPRPQSAAADLLETRRGDMPNLAPPPMPQAMMQNNTPMPPMMGGTGTGLPPLAAQSSPALNQYNPNASMGMQQYGSSPTNQAYNPGMSPAMSPNMHMGNPGSNPANPQYPSAAGVGYHMAPVGKKSNTWVWIVVGLLALGAAAGAVLAVVMK